MDKSKITSIGALVLYQAYASIGSLDFPNLSVMGTSCFQDYREPGKIQNLGNVVTIPEGCFRSYIPDDKTYRFPASVTTIGNLSLFNDNRELIYYLYPTTPPTLGGSQVFRQTPAAIYVPSESVQAYKEAAGWSSYANNIQAIPE